MIAIIVISLFALIGAVYTIYVWQRNPSDDTGNHYISAPHFKEGLFARADASLPLVKQAERTGAKKTELLERARNGDLDALSLARQTGDESAYAAVLDVLIDSSQHERLSALVSHVSKSSDLRANKRLAQLLLETWKAAPDTGTTIELIHIAALSDDPDTYGEAVDATLGLWRSGNLPWFRPEELAELFFSEYWVIAPEARSGGAGFALKHKLLGIRRELESAPFAH